MALTQRYVRSDAAGGGDGTTDTNSGVNGAWTLAEGVTNEAAGMCLNVVAIGGTFANTTTNRTFAAAGTTTAPIWWRGCNSTPGDLDSNQALAKPALTFTTGQLSVTGTQHIFTDLNISGATTTANGLAVNSSLGTVCVWDRCSFTNTAANSASKAYTANGTVTLSRCTFSATATATIVVSLQAEASVESADVTGGGVGISHGSAACAIRGGTIHSTGSHGYEMTSGTTRTLTIEGVTFTSCGGDAIRFTGLPSIGLLSYNTIGGSGGFAINNNTGTNSNVVKRLGNSYPTTNTSGNANGFGDSPEFVGTPPTSGSTIIVLDD